MLEILHCIKWDKNFCISCSLSSILWIFPEILDFSFLVKLFLERKTSQKISILTFKNILWCDCCRVVLALTLYTHSNLHIKEITHFLSASHSCSFGYSISDQMNCRWQLIHHRTLGTTKISRRCTLKAYIIKTCTLEALHRVWNHPMIGNRFTYISRMGQIESLRKKFVIILLVREKI